MKSAALVSFTFFVSTIALPAQSGSIGVGSIENIPSFQANQIYMFQRPLTAQGCPVSLRAQQGPAGGMVQVDRNRPEGTSQRLHLNLFNPEGKQIVSALVRAHGLSAAGRTTFAVSDSLKPDSTRTLVVHFAPDSPKTVTGDMWVPGMTAVLAIDLNSVTFTDGSTRTFTKNDGCHVVPDLKMLIAGQ